MKFNDIFTIYEEIKSPLLSKQTFKTYQSYYYTHIAPVFGDIDITVPKYIDYQKFVNDLLTVGLKPKTAKNILMLLSSIYKFAKLNGWYEGEDIIKLVELPRFDNKRYFTISKELQVKYIKAILNFNEPIYKDIFLFLLHGRRLSEVLNMRWEYIDLENRIYYLPAKVNKSKKNLSFQMTDKLYNMLDDYRDIAEIRTIKSKLQNKSPYINGYVFLNPATGLPYKDIRRAWKRLLSSADLPKMRIHDIRHLIATYTINELGLTVESVSHTLGHSDITITQKYLNPKPENSKKVIDKVLDSVTGKKFIKELDQDFAIAQQTKNLYKSLAEV